MRCSRSTGAAPHCGARCSTWAGGVLDEREVARGMLTIRPGGFADVFEEHFGDWMEGRATRCLMAGMVGSQQGWVEAPYCPCPAGLDDIAGRLLRLTPAAGTTRRIAIVPGISCERGGVPDVMRGEEIKILGALDLLGTADATLVLPGTHSKWATVEGGRIRSFSTVMSGEFYALLRQHSILARTLPPDDGALDGEAFDRGVAHAFEGRQPGADRVQRAHARSVRPHPARGDAELPVRARDRRGAALPAARRAPRGRRDRCAGVGRALRARAPAARHRRAPIRRGGGVARPLGHPPACDRARRGRMSEASTHGIVDRFEAAMQALPLVAILRGLKPDEAVAIGRALVDADWHLIEVPLNSPDRCAASKRSCRRCPRRWSAPARC
jgi:2-keto-3-deoxy-galactonokinase